MQQQGDDPYYLSPLSYQRQKVSPQRRKRFQVGCAGAAGLMIIGAFIGFLLGLHVGGDGQTLASNANANTNVQASVATMEPAQTTNNADQVDALPPVPAPTPAPPTAWVVTQTFVGNGNQKTEDFSVGDVWKLQWSCGSGTTSENIIIDVDSSDGSPVDLNAINTICNVGNTSGETVERQGGSMYLDIKSEGGWIVQILEQQ